MGCMTTLDDLLATVGVPAGHDDDPLDLGSLEVVTLVLEIEKSCGLRLGAKDVKRETFATRAALRALLAGKGVAC